MAASRAALCGAIIADAWPFVERSRVLQRESKQPYFPLNLMAERAAPGRVRSRPEARRGAQRGLEVSRRGGETGRGRLGACGAGWGAPLPLLMGEGWGCAGSGSWRYGAPS